MNEVFIVYRGWDGAGYGRPEYAFANKKDANAALKLLGGDWEYEILTPSTIVTHHRVVAEAKIVELR